MYWSCCKMQLQNVTSNNQEICHWYLLQYGRNSSPVFSALDPGWRGMSLRSGLVIVLCSWAKHFLLRVPLYTCSRKRSSGGLAFQSLEFSPRILNLMFPYETTLTPPRVFSKCCYTDLTSPRRKVWMSLSVHELIFQCFSGHNLRRFRQTTLD